MSQYTTGLVNVVSGQATVTGVGTTWSADGIVSGYTFKKRNENAIYEIGSVPSNTQLILTSAYVGSGENNVQYQITKDFTSNLDLYEIWKSDIDWPYHLTASLRILDTLLAAYNRKTSNWGIISTTNATPTTVITTALEDGAVTMIEADIVGICTGGAGGNSGKGGAYKAVAAFRRISGEASVQIGSTSKLTTLEDAGITGWDVNISASSNNAIVTVTGGSTDNIDWSATVDVQDVQ